MVGRHARGGAGGIVRLNRLTVEHPDLFADFRDLYHCSLSDLPVWESCLLVRSLLSDPRSRVATSIAGWDHPVSREWMMLAAIHDVTIDVSGVKSPAQYHLHRPWRNAGKPKRKPRTVPELRAALKPWG